MFRLRKFIHIRHFREILYSILYSGIVLVEILNKYMTKDQYQHKIDDFAISLISVYPKIQVGYIGNFGIPLFLKNHTDIVFNTGISVFRTALQVIGTRNLLSQQSLASCEHAISNLSNRLETTSANTS